MPNPRLSPPDPVQTKGDQLQAAAAVAGLELMPWQVTAARHLMAGNGKWQYPEVAVVVARQNGKSTLLIPRILWGLEHGERIMHTAQNRTLPREIFEQVAELVPKSSLKRPVRLANGQERIDTRSGGCYRIVAPTRGGARGPSNDLVIIDEVREMDTWDFMAASRPTLTASRNPQTLYLSNAGEDTSVVLNSLRERAVAGDDRLAYLEWSAHPERDHMDKKGWEEANPALGLTIDLSTLETAHDSLPPPVFETEHLCRWVITTLPRLVSEVFWFQRQGETGYPVRPAMGISVDPSGSRASAVIAWQAANGIVELQTLAHVTGSPIDLDRFGQELEQKAREVKVTAVAYDQWTDMGLARHLSAAKPLQGAEWANASERFVRAVEGGWCRHSSSAEISSDLAFTVRKGREDGSFIAVKALEERPITAALAAVRAVWLASNPVDKKPRMY
jgi:terminase large subunit-like protein